MTSVLIGPLLYIFSIQLFDSQNHTVLNGIYPLIYTLAIILGGLISVPAFILLWTAFMFAVRASVTRLKIKLILVVLSIILSFITTALIPSVDKIEFWSFENIELTLCYSVVLVLSILLYDFDLQLVRLNENLGEIPTSNKKDLP